MAWSRIRRLIYMCFMIQQRSLSAACMRRQRRGDRFDYLLGAGNGDSPSSFRNALCFAVDS